MRGDKTPLFKLKSMKVYLHIYEVEADDNELIMKVEPLYCAEGSAYSFNVTPNDYTPTKGDKLYFLPGVNIPRVKLKDLSLQHGIKTVRDIDQATHVFVGKNTKDKIVNGHWYYTINTSAVRAILNDPDLVMDDYYKENLNQALEFYTEPIVVVDYHSATELRNSELPFVKRYMIGNLSRSSTTFYSVDDDHKDLFPGIMNLELYDESKLLKHINGDDAATIDETMFLQISDMFKSSDQDNHILAMEIMANCNYMDSLLYIEMLFEKYENQMYNCHTKNHVNFKSLLSFLGKKRTYMNTDIDDVVKSLINKGVFDIDKVNVIMKYYGEAIANQGGTDFFEVKSLTLSEEAAKLLNTNYVHQTFPDFIPEGGVEVPEIHGDLVDLNTLSPGVAEVDDVCNESAQEEELADEDIEDAFTNIVRNELKSELIALEEEDEVSGLETNKEPEPEEEIDNNQTIQTKDDDFEWF
jgi:hypothetical protein